MGADSKRKEARKRKFGIQPDDAAHQPEDLSKGTSEQPPAKKIKQRTPHQAPSEATATIARDDTKNEGTEISHQGSSEDPSKKAQRFIVFVGNLPFTASEATIRKHFIKTNPTGIRHRTEKETGKSKGFAFLEFAGYDRMKTCLKLYHHSSFDDGESPARKLNVELTAGGGGAKSKNRQSKLRAKNEKLNEQRQRRADNEQKQANQANQTKKVEEPQRPSTIDNGDIHPSRRGRLLAT